MYALSADISMIRQKETRKQVLHLEHHSKTYQMTGHARHAELAWNTLKSTSKKKRQTKSICDLVASSFLYLHLFIVKVCQTSNRTIYSITDIP